MSEKSREHGYYWVKRDNTWQIMEWYIGSCSTGWYGVGFEMSLIDEELQEINENRIVKT